MKKIIEIEVKNKVGNEGVDDPSITERISFFNVEYVDQYCILTHSDFDVADVDYVDIDNDAAGALGLNHVDFLTTIVKNDVIRWSLKNSTIENENKDYSITLEKISRAPTGSKKSMVDFFGIDELTPLEPAKWIEGTIIDDSDLDELKYVIKIRITRSENDTYVFDQYYYIDPKLCIKSTN